MSNTRDDNGGLVGEPIGMNDLFSQELDIQHHDTYDRHEFGKSFPIPGIPTPIGTTPKPGSSLAPARADHTHSIPASMVRNATHLISPVLLAGDIPSLVGSNPIRIPASQVNVTAVPYTRYAIISASIWFQVPVAAQITLASAGLEVHANKDGSGFTLLANRLYEQATILSTTLSGSTTGLTYVDTMQINGNSTYAFQIAANCNNGSHTVSPPSSVRMTVLLIPAAPIG